MTLRIAICADGESGKDYAAKFLAEHTELRYERGTSWYARDYVFDWFQKNGAYYLDAVDCWNDRRNHRNVWARCIDEINAEDGACLYRDCIENGNDILTGIRRKHELDAIKAAGLVDVWVWINAGIHGTKGGICRRDDNGEWKQVLCDPTQEFGPRDCNLQVNNVGDLDEFDVNLLALAKLIGLRERVG